MKLKSKNKSNPSPKIKTSESSYVILHKKTLGILWLACFVGAWTSLPYQYFLLALPESTSYIDLFWLATMEEGIISGIACYLSFYILRKTDLNPFSFQECFKKIIYPGVIIGILTGIVAHVLLIKDSAPSSILARPPAWAGALASIHAAINQEVLFRLFLLSLTFFLIKKCFAACKNYQSLWVANVISALLFGLAHLIGGSSIGISSSFEIFQALYLNTFIGLVFGWLFFSRGFWAAALAHGFFALTLHGFFA